MKDERLLVLHDRPQEVVEVVARQFPALSMAIATRPEEVVPALAAHQPTIVLSIKHAGFPGAAHRPAVRHRSVQWFHVGGSGVEHLAPWSERVQVTNCAGVLAPFLAETATAALLSLTTGLHRYARKQRQREWSPHRFRPLAGRTLLVVGLGATGGAFAERAKALGMRVVGIRASGEPHPAAEAVYPPSALRRLLPLADVVSLHIRHTRETHHLMSKGAIEKMKPGALLLNSSRGGIVDQRALLGALLGGHLGGAWLDVFETEPLPMENPLWGLPNVIVTPHAADQVADFPARFAERFCALLPRYLAGEPLPVVSLPAAERVPDAG
jgi:phosphoglycerate dehydrogenase-like enzyme